MAYIFRNGLAAAVAWFSPMLAHAHDAALLGCWSAESIVQFRSDGTSVRSTPRACPLQFEQDRIKSSCGEIVYTYKVIRDGVYTATMIAHGNRPDLVGGTREYEYRIEDGHLFITTYPQTTKPAPPSELVRVESKSRKVQCR